MIEHNSSALETKSNRIFSIFAFVTNYKYSPHLLLLLITIYIIVILPYGGNISITWVVSVNELINVCIFHM